MKLIELIGKSLMVALAALGLTFTTGCDKGGDGGEEAAPAAEEAAPAAEEKKEG